MARSVSNVQITTDSFYGLINKTNVLLHGMTVEFVTTANSISGANTSGNCNVIGTVSAPTVGTSLLKGSNGTSASNVSTLSIGISNSTISSNVTISGYSANIVANNINVLSNTLIQTSNLHVNTAVTRIISNTSLSGNSTSNNITVTGNAIATSVTVVSNVANITVDSLSINSVSTITGNTIFKSNSTSNNLTLLTDGITSNVTISGNVITVTSNLVLTGNLNTIVGNTAFDNNVLFVDSVNNRVGIGTSTPDHEFEIVAVGNTPYFVLVNDTFGTTLHVTSSNSATTNTINFFATNNINLKLASNNNVGSGYLFISSNGNIGLANDSPEALVSIGNTRVYTNGTIQTSGDLICTGDLYANIVFMGGSNQATVTATVCPIVPPNTSYSSLNLEASTIQGPNPYNTFTNTTPQRIDVIKQTEYQATKYTLQVQDVDSPNEVFMTEVSVIYGYGNAHVTTYGTIFTNTAFIDVTVDANSTFYSLMAVPTSSYLASKGGTVNLQFRGVRQKCR